MAAVVDQHVITPGSSDSTNFSAKHLQTLRNEFPNIPDEELLRYLIARNDNIHKAKEQLYKAQALKLKLGWPIRQQDCFNEMQTGKIYCRGNDKEGRPIILFHSGLHDTGIRNLEETQKLLIWWAEHVFQTRTITGFSKATILVNLSSDHHIDIQLFKSSVSLFQVSNLTGFSLIRFKH
jgi:hypothetical protein